MYSFLNIESPASAGRSAGMTILRSFLFFFGCARVTTVTLIIVVSPWNWVRAELLDVMCVDDTTRPSPRESVRAAGRSWFLQSPRSPFPPDLRPQSPYSFSSPCVAMQHAHAPGRASARGGEGRWTVTEGTIVSVVSGEVGERDKTDV